MHKKLTFVKTLLTARDRSEIFVAVGMSGTNEVGIGGRSHMTSVAKERGGWPKEGRLPEFGTDNGGEGSKIQKFD